MPCSTISESNLSFSPITSSKPSLIAHLSLKPASAGGYSLLSPGVALRQTSREVSPTSSENTVSSTVNSTFTSPRFGGGLGGGGVAGDVGSHGFSSAAGRSTTSPSLAASSRQTTPPSSASEDIYRGAKDRVSMFSSSLQPANSSQTIRPNRPHANSFGSNKSSYGGGDSLLPPGSLQSGPSPSGGGMASFGSFPFNSPNTSSSQAKPSSPRMGLVRTLSGATSSNSMHGGPASIAISQPYSELPVQSHQWSSSEVSTRRHLPTGVTLPPADMNISRGIASTEGMSNPGGYATMPSPAADPRFSGNLGSQTSFTSPQHTDRSFASFESPAFHTPSMNSSEGFTGGTSSLSRYAAPSTSSSSSGWGTSIEQHRSAPFSTAPSSSISAASASPMTAYTYDARHSTSLPAYTTHSSHEGPTFSLPPPSTRFGHVNASGHVSGATQSSTAVNPAATTASPLNPNNFASGSAYWQSLSAAAHASGGYNLDVERFGRTTLAKPPPRIYNCPSCPATFSRNHDLKRHTRIHLVVKPFPCGYCEKSFSRKDALKRHILVKGCGTGIRREKNGMSGGAGLSSSSSGGHSDGRTIVKDDPTGSRTVFSIRKTEEGHGGASGVGSVFRGMTLPSRGGHYGMVSGPLTSSSASSSIGAYPGGDDASHGMGAPSSVDGYSSSEPAYSTTSSHAGYGMPGHAPYDAHLSQQRQAATGAVGLWGSDGAPAQSGGMGFVAPQHQIAQHQPSPMHSQGNPTTMWQPHTIKTQPSPAQNPLGTFTSASNPPMLSLGGSGQAPRASAAFAMPSLLHYPSGPSK